MRITDFSFAGLIATALFSAACASTSSYPTMALTEPVVVVSASAMLAPDRAATFTKVAIQAQPEQAVAFTTAAVSAAPSYASDITRAAITVAPDRAMDIVAAARDASRPRRMSTYQTIPRTEYLVEVVARASR